MRHHAFTIRLGLLGLVSAALLGQAQAAPPRPALEIAVTPDSTSAGLMVYALAHDLMARLEAPIPRRRPIVFVDRGSPPTPGVPRVSLAASPSGLQVTWPHRGNVPPEPEALSAEQLGTLANQVATRLGWPTPKAQPPLPDAVPAGFLLVVPERVLATLDPPSPRALELFLRHLEGREEPLSQALVSDLHATMVASNELIENKPDACFENAGVLATIAAGGSLADTLRTAIAERNLDAVLDSIDAIRGPGLESAWHAAAISPSARAHLMALAAVYAPRPDLLAAALEHRDRWGATPLLRALWAGRTDAARLLVGLGARLAARTSDGVNALHAAARAGLASEIPGLALRLAAPYLDQRDARGLTPLGHAVRAPAGAVATTVAALLRAGATVGPDAVAGACATGDLGLAASLFKGASAAQADLAPRAAEAALRLGMADFQNAGWTAYSEEKPSSSIAFACVSVVAGVSDAGLFAKALEYGRPDLATSLLLMGLSPHARSSLDGSSLLHLAARHHEAGLVRVLAALGADPTALDRQLASALEVAVEVGHLPTLRALLEVSDGRVDLAVALDRAFETATEPAVFAAIVEGRWESLALTPLEAARVAVVLGDATRLEPLLAAHGPEVIGQQAPHGLGLIHFAARFGQVSLIERLLRLGEPLDLEVTAGTRWRARDLTGWTALHLAAFHGRIATYHALVASGARSTVAADGTRPEDHLRLGGMISGDLGAIGSAGGWESQLGWPVSAHDYLEGDTPESSDLPERVKPVRPIPPLGPPHMSRPPNAVGRVSFVGLGGGILLDEEPGPELEPRRETVAGKADAFGPADGWQEQIEGCLDVLERDAERRPGELARPESEARERRLRALAVARSRAQSLVAERSRMRIGLGPAVLAVAEQTLARVELAAKNPVAAEEVVARSEARSMGAIGPMGPMGAMRVNAVALALTLTKARAQRARGALALAIETLGRVGLQTGEVWARIQHWRGLWLGEQARYGEAVAALRFAVAARPGHFASRLNLATLLGRVGAKDEAKALAETLHEGASKAGATAVEAAVAAFSAGLWRLTGGDSAGRIMVEKALKTIGEWSIGHPAIGRVALALARLERGERRYAEAQGWLATARTALVMSDGEDAAIIGAVAGEECEVLRESGRLDEALAKCHEAYLAVVASEEPELVWPVERALARVYRARAGTGGPGLAGLSAAIVFGKRAVATLERIRAEVRKTSPELVRGFTEDRIAAWRELANDLVKAERYVEALSVLESLKIDERASLATRELTQEHRVPVVMQAEKAPTVAVSEQAERQLRALTLAREERALTPRETAEVATLRAKLRERRKAFEVWLVSLEDELAKMPPKRAQQIAALNLRDVAAIQGTLERIGPTVAVLHYVFADDKLRVVVTTAKGQVGRDAELGAADVGALVVAFREQLIDPTSDPRPVARELWGQLIGPIEADLKEGEIDTLFFALDGPLRYLPMAALWDGERWLVERFKVAHLARAALDKLESRAKATDAMAALGSAKAIPGYAPLTAVVDELEGVVKRDEADLSGVMPGVIRLDEAFTREALTELLESRKYATYHIASHFVLAGGEGESYLLLGDGQKLSLTDIRYELRFDGVDLLALSACNTAVGEETDGRELEGFASLALRLGARQVLATLWPVGDTSTGRLMQSLYRWQQVVGVGRAEALRLAMLGLIRGTDVKLDDKAKGMAGAVAWGVCGELGGDRHPFHWAPFILVGSWL